MRAALVFASQSVEVKVYAEQAAAALQFLHPMKHRRHQLPVECVHGFQVQKLSGH